ncbi:MAG TPA: glycosyltransferase family 1 protein [Chloroflexota bacterium]|nr:glycosyltransferase family 1 protein [Chloroflexota bacterium]
MIATVRIAIDVRVTQGGYPGIGRATEGLVTALLALKTAHRFFLIYEPRRRLPADLRAALRAPHALLPIGAALRGPRDQLELPLRLRQARADLYHATYYAMALAPACPYVLNVFDLIPERYPRYWPRVQAAVIRRWLRRASARAACIFVPSHATAGDLETIYGISPARIAVTPLAADARWQPHGEPLQDGGSMPPYLLCVCTNKPHKNLTRLVEAFALARRRQPSMPDLVIAGGWDPRYPEAQRRALALGIDAGASASEQGIVRFVQQPDDHTLQCLYRGALGFVFPSEYEGFGLPVLEAMTAGLPVAASHTPAIAEVAGEAYLPFDPLDTQSIAAALLRLAGDPAVRERVAAAGRRRAGQFSWHDTARRTLDVYDRLAPTA